MPLSLGKSIGPQVREMFRNGHLGELQNFLEVTNTKRSAVQEMEDAKPRFVAETSIDFEELHRSGPTYTFAGI